MARTGALTGVKAQVPGKRKWKKQDPDELQRDVSVPEPDRPAEAGNRHRPHRDQPSDAQSDEEEQVALGPVGGNDWAPEPDPDVGVTDPLDQEQDGGEESGRNKSGADLSVRPGTNVIKLFCR
jgi:hypothetical protein